ncbi:MAG: 16S rRNA (cytidine(1402)-2'-O)-methyltransferase [Candidatus Binatus sp.]|jgi:16S rRNA (cytidine1402-2'-O)-methyltransferase|uniref:16S rRNA (cytidine(1402)-2'-O)-methyltransferase n=1 Tax=Candidatus Binatus sp. TaxID=2811406 RepID=UPI003CBAF85E
MSTRANKQTDAGGILYVVATPIGNPGDISARAIRTLEEVSLIACEDTRRTGQMLARHQIHTPTVSHFEHNEERRVPELIARLKAGEKIALVTDAGTPAISDPGFRLVRAAWEADVRVMAVPGASAAIAALSIAGIPTDRFTFEGFIPARDAARRSRLEELRREPRTMVFYEAARRLADTLAEMATALGQSRDAAVVSEITKTYEKTARGTLGELERRFRATPALGEITIIVAGAPATASIAGADAGSVTVNLGEALEVLREAGLGLKQASAVVARLTGRGRREVYQNALKSRSDDSSDD